MRLEVVAKGGEIRGLAPAQVVASSFRHVARIAHQLLDPSRLMNMLPMEGELKATVDSRLPYEYTWTFHGCVFFCRLAKHHKFQSFAVKNAVSFQKCRFNVFTEVAKLAVGKSRRLVGESRHLVGKSRRFKTLTYHGKHVNAKSASVQNSWRLFEKAVLIEQAEKTCILMKTQVY